MSKSLGNYIGITDEPNVMFEKVMKIPDELMEKYLILLTDMTTEEIDRLMSKLGGGELHPRALKMILAEEIVTLYHDEEAALAARNRFVDVLCYRKIPADIKSMKVTDDSNIVQLIVKAGFAVSNSEARRLVAQKGVKVNRQVVEDIECHEFEDGAVLQVGKKKFVKLVS